MDEEIWILDDELIETSFDTSGYTFYKGGTGVLGTPAEAFLRLVAVKGDERLIVETIEALSGYVTIRTPDEALEFGRLFTSVDTHYLFPEVSYVEPVYVEGDPGVAEYSDDYADQMRLPAARVSEQSGVFVVERALLSKTQRLVHATETIAPDGTYELHDVTTLDEHAPIQYPVYE